MSVSLNRDGSSKNQVLITSILFMGLSHILYFKQYIKGILYTVTEVVGICFIPFVINGIYNLITLGEPQPNLPVKERDNSILYVN